MESNNIRSLIVDMVESFFPRFSAKNKVLTMTLNFSWNSYDEDGENDINFRRQYLVVFYRPNNYTMVMVKEGRTSLFNNDNKIELDLTSNHDSCWREDGMKFIYKTFSEAWDFFEKRGIEGREINPMINFDMIGKPTFWEVKELKVIEENRKVEIQFDKSINKE